MVDLTTMNHSIIEDGLEYVLTCLFIPTIILICCIQSLKG